MVQFYDTAMNAIEEPLKHEEAVSRSEKNKWNIALQAELNSVNVNCTLVEAGSLPGSVVIPCKMIFKTRPNYDGHIF